MSTVFSFVFVALCALFVVVVSGDSTAGSGQTKIKWFQSASRIVGNSDSGSEGVIDLDVTEPDDSTGRPDDERDTGVHFCDTLEDKDADGTVHLSGSLCRYAVQTCSHVPIVCDEVHVGGAEKPADDDVDTLSSSTKESTMSEVIAKADAQVCAALVESFTLKGFLSPREIARNCLHDCKFPVSCGDGAAKPGGSQAMARLETWADALVENKVSIPDDEEVLTEEMTETWHVFFSGSVGLLLSVMPIMLNQWKYYNYWWAGAYTSIFLFVHVFGFFTNAVTLHNVVIAMMCALLPAGSHVLTEGIIALVIQFVLIGAAFNSDPVQQVLVFMSGIIGYFVYLYWSFFVRRSGATGGVIIMMLHAFVMIERVNYARTHFGLHSFAQIAIEMAFNAIMPYGKYQYYCKNALYLALKVVRYIDYGDMRAFQLASVMVVQLVMLLAFRAGLGTFYIHTLRYKLEAGTVSRGLWVYMIDFFGPLRVFWRVLFRYETPNARRVMYAAVGTCLMWSELHGAVGFFWLRFVCSLIDAIGMHTPEGQAMHYLEFNIDFMQVAFPQKGAPPYMSFKMLNSIADNVGVVIATNADKSVRGMGVVLRSAGSAMLYSVRHVVDSARQIVFQEDCISSPDFRDVTEGRDPVVAMKYCGDAVDVDILTSDEVRDVQQLVFINVLLGKGCEVLDRVISVIPRFRIQDGKLSAAVNLRKGDSGGPCFAVLTDGTIRFCGVVSQGNPRQGGGNIISFCYSDGDIGANSSDDESVGHGKNVRQFNRVRRVNFATDDPNKRRVDAARRLNEYLNNNTDVWHYTSSRAGRNVSWDDVSDPQQSAEDFFDAHQEAIGRDTERGSNGADAEGDGDGPKSKGQRKRDAKKRNKDKAARKRAHLNCANTCRVLKESLLNVYSDVDARNIYDAVVKGGEIPPLDSCTFICATDGRGFILDTELPDPAWS